MSYFLTGSEGWSSWSQTKLETRLRTLSTWKEIANFSHFNGTWTSVSKRATSPRFSPFMSLQQPTKPMIYVWRDNRGRSKPHPQRRKLNKKKYFTVYITRVTVYSRTLLACFLLRRYIYKAKLWSTFLACRTEKKRHTSVNSLKMIPKKSLFCFVWSIDDSNINFFGAHRAVCEVKQNSIELVRI